MTPAQLAAELEALAACPETNTYEVTRFVWRNMPSLIEALRMAKADYADEFGPCAVCGGACNPLAANPSLWPSLTGHRKYAHLECVQKAIEALRRMEKLEKERDYAVRWGNKSLDSVKEVMWRYEDALKVIAANMEEYIDKHDGTVDVTIGLAYETARAALSGDAQ